MSRQPTAKRPTRAAASAADLVDLPAAIRILQTTRPTFYRWLRAGKLKGLKVGHRWRFRHEDLDRFVRGEAPRIELPMSLTPLIKQLQARLPPDQRGSALPADEVQRVIQLTIRLAGSLKASDIHLAPLTKASGDATTAALRYRVAGALHQAAEFDLRLLPPIIQAWKTMAACDLHERQKPQDGRILLTLDGQQLDLRVCFLAAVYGESLTARLLDRNSVSLSLDRMDYALADQERLRTVLHSPWGLIIATGPTGSGKTTTLYACLNEVTSPDVKVLSIEDPVEYLLPGVVQVQIRPAAGLTFASAARAALRSDPDVILISEIRDFETMTISFQAALTGHLVLSTLHTNSALSALRRMVDIGAEPFLAADATKLIVCQRLVRILCPACSKAAKPPAAKLARAEELARAGGVDWDGLPKEFRAPVGCAQCRQLGYRGRTVMAEVLEMTPKISAPLIRGATVDELQAVAVSQGMTTLAADGVRRAATGQTTLDEVLRFVELR